MRTHIVAIDPGTAYCGYAVLTPPATVVVSGTWIPRRSLSQLDCHLWLLSKCQDLLRTWHADLLVYEEFLWPREQSTVANTQRYIALERFLGGLQALALCPPHPVLMPLRPGQWHTSLGILGSRRTKEAVAQAVNIRLGTALTGDFYSNHVADALGIALAAVFCIVRLSTQSSLPDTASGATGT